MADHDEQQGPDEQGPDERRGPDGTDRGRPDLVTLVAGLVSLGAAVLVLTGWAPDLSWLDPRWGLAAGAVILGLAMLAGALRADRTRAPDAPDGPVTPASS